MASLPILWIAARAYCQATEEEERVVKALDTVVPEAAATRDRLEGQYGNPVVSIATRLEASTPIRATWDRWRTADIIRMLREDLESRVDEEGVLHFRVDKQAAFAGNLQLTRGGDAIDVRIKLRAYPAKRTEILKVAHALVAEAD